MWQLQTRPAGSGLSMAEALTAHGRALSFDEVFAAWRTDRAFRDFWSAALRQVPFAGFCWECPMLTTTRAGAAFECVFVDSPLLAHGAPDPQPFAEHFDRASPTATFASLGRDALLVAPAPGAPGSDFGHLAAFLATADAAQASGLWQAVGEALAARLGNAPLWLSTAGLGVAWLHVRLDSRPKYYRHLPYARLG